jgi:N-acetylmuramoyl-L-alanine amidase
VLFIDRPSPNFEPRTASVDLVVLHYTGMYNADIALRRLTDPAPLAGRYPGPWQDPDIDAMTPLGRVSAHYMIDEEARVYRLVHEAHRAWHAGASSWEGRTDTNDRSIGIEIANGGHDFGLPDFPDAQIDALIQLLRDIFERWPDLNAKRVVGHSDVAPGRKLDPGEKFPWKRLAEFGVSIWPQGADGISLSPGDPVADVQEQLSLLGYGVARTGRMDAQTEAALTAFERRFRPDKIASAIDDETRRLLSALTRGAGDP